MESNNFTELENAKFTVNLIVSIVDIIILYSIAIIEFLFIILIIYNVKHKNSTFTSAYYYILAIGYCVTSLTCFMYKITYTVEKPDIYRQSFYNILQWYNARFICFWNFLLALNRFTAIFFFLKHKKIWAGKSLFAILIILILFLFILSAHTLGKIGCFFKNPYEDDCLGFFIAEFLGLANIACHVIAFVLGISTALARKIKGQKWAKKQKFETYLLIQSIVSTTLFLLSILFDFVNANYLNAYISTFRSDIEQYVTMQILFSIINYITLIAHGSSAILILCLSKDVRENFIAFYRLYYIPGIKKPSKSDETTTTPVQSLRSS